MKQLWLLAYHFTDNGRLRDGRPVPPVGKWLKHKGPLVLCESGLHASERLLDALRYAPGLTLHIVTLSGDVICDDDKLVASRRRIDRTIEVPMRAVVRLAIESACLAAWCAGLYLPQLLDALAAADREDWVAARVAANDTAWAVWATGAAMSAAGAAAMAAGAAAKAATGAATWDTLEARAVELLTGERP